VQGIKKEERGAIPGKTMGNRELGHPPVGDSFFIALSLGKDDLYLRTKISEVLQHLPFIHLSFLIGIR
jgi:hypothetical protein